MPRTDEATRVRWMIVMKVGHSMMVGEMKVLSDMHMDYVMGLGSDQTKSRVRDHCDMDSNRRGDRWIAA